MEQNKKPNKIAMRVYNHKHGVAPFTILKKGSLMHFNHRMPFACEIYRKDEKFPPFINKSQALEIWRMFFYHPNLKRLVICDRKRIRQWFKEHPDSQVTKKLWK